MKYPAPGDGTSKETDEAVYFYTPTFYPLDNYAAYAVQIWGLTFPTAEHAFQWKKFDSVQPGIAEEIHQASSPNEAKRIAREHKAIRVEDWSELRLVVMQDVLRAKFDQHPEIRELLRRTGKRAIYENSPDDSFWGIGPDGRGENRLGEMWMMLREEL